MNFSRLCLLALSTFGLSPYLCFAQFDEIPVVTINDPIRSWTPVTYVSISGGTSNVPLVVDTGSSTIAFCNKTDMGTSTKTKYYGCAAYGNGSSGWVGSYYYAQLSLGDYNESVTDPGSSFVGLMKTESSKFCTPNIKGIMGTDLNRNRFYAEEQLLPKPGGPNKCGSEWLGTYSGQFGKNMLNSANQYTFALIGLSKERNSEFVAKDKVEQTSVLAFGERARERVKEQTSAGSAAFTTDYEDWYTFSNNVTFDITGLKNETFCTVLTGGDCKVTIDYEKTHQPVIIDSGHQQLFLPWLNLDEHLKEFKEMVTEETTLTISIGDVQLSFDYDTLNDWVKGNNIVASGSTSFAKLGFPVFWMYDILFDVNTKDMSEKSYGNVTFYKRTSTTSGGANKKSSKTSKSDKNGKIGKKEKKGKERKGKERK